MYSFLDNGILRSPKHKEIHYYYLLIYFISIYLFIIISKGFPLGNNNHLNHFW